jgi:hypothetical protein
MYKMLKKAFGDNSKGITQTFKWFSQFKHGRTLVQNYEHSDRPSTGRTNKNLEKVHKIVYGDQQSTMSDIAGLLYRTCQQTVIEDLNITCGGSHKVCSSVAHQRTEAAECACLPGSVQ